MDDIKCHSWDGPEVKKKSINTASLAQEDDINNIENELIQNNIKDGIIGVAVSKGAATLINGAALGKIKNLKALVLESPFADANNVMHDHAAITTLRCLSPLCFFLFLNKKTTGTVIGKSIFSNYNPHGIQPLEVIDKIQKDVPIIFIHSQKDSLISVNHSRKLYRKLIQEGRKNVYLVETKKGSHANVFWHKDNSHAINIVHKFYKHHDLPHNSELISDDMDLKEYQPTLEEINKKIR